MPRRFSMASISATACSKPSSAERLVLAALEVLAQRVVLVRAHELVAGQEEHRVLARGVGLVHADEGRQLGAQLPAPLGILHRGRRRQLPHASP
jgi:hypothetical protein